MFLYVYYVRREPIFLVAAIVIAFPYSLYLYFSGRSILKNIKNDFYTHKNHYTLFFIGLCLSIIGTIIILLKCN